MILTDLVGQAQKGVSDQPAILGWAVNQVPGSQSHVSHPARTEEKKDASTKDRDSTMKKIILLRKRLVLSIDYSLV